MAELLISTLHVAGAGTDSDSFGTLEIFATENNDGSVTFRVAVGDDWNTNYNLDLNGLFLDYQDGGSSKLTVDGQKSLNLNGTTDPDGNSIFWDVAASSGSNAGAHGGTTVMEFSVTVANLSLAAIDGGLIGLRATSTGLDSSGSLKLVGVIDIPEAPIDSYPHFEKDISHATLVFNAEGMEAGADANGDGYYAVKIDEWEGSNDLDTELAAIMAWLVENDPHITGDTVLLGAQIKGGNVGTAAGSYDDFWANDGDSSYTTEYVLTTKPNDGDATVTAIVSADEEPNQLDLTNGNGSTLNGSDVSYAYEYVFA